MKLAKILGLVAVLGLVMSFAVKAADAAPAKVTGKVAVAEKVVTVTDEKGAALTVTGAKVEEVAKFAGKTVDVTGTIKDKTIDVATVAEAKADAKKDEKKADEKAAK